MEAGFNKICTLVRRVALRDGNLRLRVLAIADACDGSIRAGNNIDNRGGTYFAPSASVRAAVKQGWFREAGRQPDSGAPWYLLTASGRARLAALYEESARVIQDAS